ncbi:SPFH domain-containing protein [Patulibacter minatonensis]|uniref:SPFH domain-containing protein n=1 Tax=Patulibacter minatonensis TaxID=298163 RepID=UPI00047AF615|nr:SPFH domain-containing protein [Patulibacter minatonensis]
MAEIKTYPLLRHLRAEPTVHVQRFRGGKPVRAGNGLAFWFRTTNTTVTEVPVDDRELPFLFRARSRDFQELTVQGAITYRVTDPALVAARIDFTLDLATGRLNENPMEQVAGLLTQLAQQFVTDELVGMDLRRILQDGVAPIRDRIGIGLAGEAAVRDLGLEVVAVRVADVAPTAEVEQALQRPAREVIQQEADGATFQRRALAVQNERAIAENELQNRVELARQQEELVRQEGQNRRQTAEEEAAAALVEAQAADERGRLELDRRAATIDAVEAAKLRAETERTRIQAEAGPQVLLALALQQLAGEIGKVEHLTITPDLLQPLLGGLAAAGDATRRTEG